MAPFDVFISHNSKDKPTVRQLGEELKKRGLSVWLDEWELVPGRPWQKSLEEIIKTTQSAAVLVGKDGLGPWEEPEMRACLNEFVKRQLPVIPVLLPGAAKQPDLPLFLQAFTWVDLRNGLNDDGLDRLQWGITGKKPAPEINTIRPLENQRRAPVWQTQRRLIATHHVFGGRTPELRRLDELLENSRKPYHFVTGPSGIGKTALLANWLNHLEEREQPVCFHFINRNLGMASEQQALQNLCQQLGVIHGLGADVPVGIGELYSRYASLLARPLSEQRLIVIVDGIDEAEEWTPSAKLFPSEIPDTTKVFFSVRTDSEERRAAFLLQLGLNSAEVELVELEAIQEEEISELLNAVGEKAAPLARKPVFVQQVFDVSKGAPFYLHFLVQDIASGKITEGNIADQPKGVDAFLARWKEELFNDVDLDRRESLELLGFLAAALGPMTTKELKHLSPLLRDGVLLDREVSGRLLRYLNGDGNSGYSLCHPRFRDYLRDNVFNSDPSNAAPPDGESFGNRLLEYCQNWRTHHSNYALEHLPAHLVQADRKHEIFDLIDRDWKDARFETSHSPRSFAIDVERAIYLARDEKPPDLFQVLRCSLVYANLTTFATELPASIVGALVHLDRIAPALDYVVLNQTPSAQTRAYLAAGRALVNCGRRAELEEFLRPTLASVEQIEESSDTGRDEKVDALVALADLLRTADQSDYLARCLQLLGRLGVQLTDPERLSRIAQAFRDAGEFSRATDFEQRSQAAEEAAGKPFLDLSFMNIPGATGTTRNPSELESSIESKQEQGHVEEALEELESELAALEAEEIPVQSKRNLLTAIVRSFLTLGAADRAKAVAYRLAELGVSEDSDEFGFDTKAAQLARLSKLLSVAGCDAEAEQYALEAVVEIDPEKTFYWNTFEELAVAFLEAGRTETVREFTLELIAQVEKSGAATRRELLGRLSTILARVGEVDKASNLVDQLIREAETIELNQSRALALLGLGRAAADAGSGAAARRAVSEAEEDMRRLLAAAGPDSQPFLLPNFLEPLVYTKLSIDPQASIDPERELADRQPGLARANALDSVARGLVKAGRPQEAVRLLNLIVAEIINTITENSHERREAILRVSHTMALCGHKDWAIKEATKISKADRNLDTKAKVVLLAADDVGDQAQKELLDSFRLETTVIETDLASLLTALEAIGERGRANELLKQAQRTVLAQLSGKPWNLLPLQKVARESARRGDTNTLEAMLTAINGFDDAEKKFRALAYVSSAFIIADKTERAVRIAQGVLESLDQDTKASSSYTVLALALAELGDHEGIERLERRVRDRAKSHSNREGLFSGLLAAYGKVGNREAISRLLKESEQWRDEKFWRPMNNAILWSRAALIYHGMSLTFDAARTAARALDYFEEERDGSVTPDILEHLVPALAAVEDRDGLLRILNMRGAKRPYEREYVPAWRRVFPALARLGVFEIDEAHVRALKSGSKSEFNATESEIAVILAERGDDEAAMVRADAIDSALFRAAAHVGIARLLVDREKVDEAAALAVQAITSLVGVKDSNAYRYCPPHPSRIGLLSELAVLLERSGHRGDAWGAVQRELLNTVTTNFVTINQDVFGRSVRVLAQVGRKSDLAEATKILEAALPSDRAEGLVAIVDAFAQEGSSPEVIKRLSGARSAVEALDDVAARAVPLAILARALWLCDRQERAQELLIAAFDSARVSGRGTFFRVLEYGADIVAEALDSASVMDALDQVDSWWN